MSTGHGEPRSLYDEPERSPGDVVWPALAFRDVFKIFRSGPVETVALRGLDLEVAHRELVAVRGPSGCGKSTMLGLAAALDTPSAGEVRVCEKSLGLLDEKALAEHRASDIALVLQRDNLWPALSARENVMTSLRLSAGPDSSRDADEALAAFGLQGRERQRAGTLSGGEQQRVAIAAAAARRAKLVLADEPTGELDAANEDLVLQAFEQLRDRCESTVVLVTHSARVAEAADRIIQMRDGRVVS